MRLLFVCPEMRTGGAQRVWASLMRGLASRGHEVRLLTLADEGDLFGELAADGIPAECARMSRRGALRGLRRALAHARSRPEVVVTRGVSGQSVGEAIARRAGAPQVMTEHTPCLPSGELLPMRRHQRALTRAVARRVDRVVAVTSRQVQPLTELGYRRERIDVVPNGLFPGEVEPARDRAEVRHELGLGEADLAVLQVAALRPEKRVDGFLRAVAEARRSDPRVRGLVAGAGRELERLRPLTGEGVRLLGERRDVAELIAACDVVCLTSEAEALPMAILEAMALARPVVATDVGGTAEAVASGRTGFLVEPGDERGTARALLALSADPKAARRMGQAGKERQRELFGGERMLDGYLESFWRAVG